MTTTASYEMPGGQLGTTTMGRGLKYYTYTLEKALFCVLKVRKNALKKSLALRTAQHGLYTSMQFASYTYDLLKHTTVPDSYTSVLLLMTATYRTTYISLAYMCKNEAKVISLNKITNRLYKGN